MWRIVTIQMRNGISLPMNARGFKVQLHVTVICLLMPRMFHYHHLVSDFNTERPGEPGLSLKMFVKSIYTTEKEREKKLLAYEF